MAKDLSVVTAASGERRDVSIEQGTTAEDILAQLDLQGYVLSKDGSSASFFNPKDNIYPKVEDGQKLWASTDPKVGSLAA